MSTNPWKGRGAVCRPGRKRSIDTGTPVCRGDAMMIHIPTMRVGTIVKVGSQFPISLLVPSEDPHYHETFAPGVNPFAAFPALAKAAASDRRAQSWAGSLPAARGNIFGGVLNIGGIQWSALPFAAARGRAGACTRAAFSRPTPAETQLRGDKNLLPVFQGWVVGRPE
eukprot:2814823-Rhodomonas_salina.2